jgi:hypothetical protein
MADPLSSAAGVVGILGFALHGSKRLLEFIDGLRGAPKDITTLSTDLKALYEVLAALAGLWDELARNVSCATVSKVLSKTVWTFLKSSR